MVAIVGIHYKNYIHYTLYKSCLPIYGIAIIRSLSLLFLDDFEGNTNISVAIKSGSTVTLYMHSCQKLVTSKWQIYKAGCSN